MGERSDHAAVEAALATAGRWLVGAGRGAGRAAAAAYRAVDPDVRRHLAQMPLLGYSLLGARAERVGAEPSDGHLPLLFVHGLGGSRGDFAPLAAYLRLHGRRRSYRMALPAGEDFDGLAAAVVGFIVELLDATGEPAVQVVAHSMGGVIVRLALDDPALAGRVQAAITLGAPHAGTWAARFANTTHTRALRPSSPLMERLASTPWPEAVRGVSFWSRGDVLVQPPESAALEGTDQLEVTPFTHYSYLIDPRSWVLVRRELERAEREHAAL